MLDATGVIAVIGLIAGIILDYLFTKQGFNIAKTVMYSFMVAIGLSIMIGMLTGGLWSTLFIIVLVILAVMLLPIAYYIMQGKSISDIVEMASEIGLMASGSIPLVAIIVLAILGGLFIITGIIVLYYSIVFFIKFGLPLIVGAIASRIIFELIGV